MKKLSDFSGEKGIRIAAQVLARIMKILANTKNLELNGERNPVVMFTAFMENSPKEMREIFAILSEQDPVSYDCDAAEAMMNMLILANDPIVVRLFVSQRQTGGATSSASASENIAE